MDPRADDHFIIVCTTCRVAPEAPYLGPDLIAAMQGATLPAGFQVIGTACMSGCTRPCTVAFRAPDKASYLFGDIDPACDQPALIDFARLYAASADGQTRLMERPKALRRKTLARIPALPR